MLQTKEEYAQIKKSNLKAENIVSPAVLSNEEIDFWVKESVPVNLSSLEEVEYFITTYPSTPLHFRLDLTSKGKQRTGIKIYQLEKFANILKVSRITPRSFHVYVGTSSSCQKVLQNSARAFRIFKKYFPDASSINLGGGFGFNYATSIESRKHFPWNEYFRGLNRLLKKYEIPESIKIILEPGRDIFADSGIFLLSVNRIITHKANIKIATNGSYVYVPSSTIRKRQHKVNFFAKDFIERKPDNKRGFLSGCTTLSSDYIFPGSISVPKNISKGDFIVIKDMGAYTATQHMEFLNKKPCSEILIRENGEAVRITRRGDEADKLRYLLTNPEKI